MKMLSYKNVCNVKKNVNLVLLKINVIYADKVI